MPVDVVGSSTFGVYPKISTSKTYNMFISDKWLINFAGWRKVNQIQDSGEGRGIFRSIRGNIAVAVINNAVYKIDINLNASLVGTIATSTGQVFMAENLSAQICIADGLNAYIYNRNTNALVKQTLSADLIPNYVSYHNTYFLFGNGDISGNGSKWFAYEYATDTTIQLVQEMALQTKSDYAIAVTPIPGQGNNVLVFGTSVCEIHTDVGGLEVYRRNRSTNVDYGCASVSTIAKSDKYIAWLAINENNAPTIMVFSANGNKVISTDGIDALLSSVEHPSKSFAFMFRQDGHLFYQITFYDPADNVTLVYDFDSDKFYHLSDHCVNYHPARHVIYFNDTLYFVNINNASLYELSSKYTTYDENILGIPSADYDDDINHEIPRTRITNFVRSPDTKRMRAISLFLALEQGNDPNITQLDIDGAGINYIVDENGDYILSETGAYLITEDSITDGLRYRPRIDLSLSKDGGVTFGRYVGREMKPLANRQNEMSWDNMGAFNEIVFKFKFWGTSRFVVNNATLYLG